MLYLDPTSGSGILQWAAVLQRVAGYASSRGGTLLCAEAIDLLKRSWILTKAKIEPDHPGTLVTMSNLAEYYEQLGDSERAAETGLECWRMRKEQRGQDHPATLMPMSNLAGTRASITLSCVYAGKISYRQPRWNGAT